MIFRLSQKLNQKIKTGTLETLTLHQNPFADWSCHIFPANRRQYILQSNTKSLYSCVMPAKGITDQKQFAESALDCIRDFTADDANQWAFRIFSLQKVKRFSIRKPSYAIHLDLMSTMIDAHSFWYSLAKVLRLSSEFNTAIFPLAGSHLSKMTFFLYHPQRDQ